MKTRPFEETRKAVCRFRGTPSATNRHQPSRSLSWPPRAVEADRSERYFGLDVDLLMWVRLPNMVVVDEPSPCGDSRGRAWCGRREVTDWHEGRGQTERGERRLGDCFRVPTKLSSLKVEIKYGREG